MSKFDSESFKVWANNHRALVIAGVLGIVLILSLIASFLFGALDNWRDWRFIKKQQQNINAVQTNVNEANANIANLKMANHEAQVNVNVANNNHINSMEKTDEEKLITNQFADNANRIRNANYSGSNSSSANSARCKAYPNSAGCR